MHINAKYRLLQSGYWMLFCAGYGYVTYVLSAAGYATGEIGLITALFGTGAALLQPPLGRLADRGVCGGWRGLLMLLDAAALCIGTVLFFFCQKPLIGPLYGLLLLCISCMMPLVNTAVFHCQTEGVRLDFGIARGFGSLSYALLSLLLGRLTAALGVRPVPAVIFLSAGVIMAATALMPAGNASAAVSSKPSAETAATVSRGSFVKRYPRFCLMLAAAALQLTFHNITNTYLIQILEAVGGDSSSLGTALALAAMMELPVLFGFSLLHKRFSAGWLMMMAGFAYVVKAALFLLARSVGGVYCSQIFQMFAFAVFASASVYYAEESMAPADKVSGQAMMSATLTVGAVVGNLLGGWVQEHSGVPAMLWMAFAFAALGAVFAVAAQWGVKKPVAPAVTPQA